MARRTKTRSLPCPSNVGLYDTEVTRLACAMALSRLRAADRDAIQYEARRVLTTLGNTLP